LTSHVANDDTGTFDIKITRTRVSLGTTPVLGYAKTAATTEYIWDENGDLTIRAATLSGNLDMGSQDIVSVDQIGIAATGPDAQLEFADTVPVIGSQKSLYIAFNAYYDSAWKRIVADANAFMLQVSADDELRIWAQTDGQSSAGDTITWNERFNLDTRGNLTMDGRLTAATIGAFTAAGAIDFGNQNMTNVDIDSGDIEDAVTCTKWDDHVADNSQAHTDYLINTGDDSTAGKLTATGFSFTDTTKGIESSGTMIVTNAGTATIRVGEGAGLNNSGDNLAAIGYQAAYNNTGNGNFAAGYQALYTNTAGFSNLALGYQAGFRNSTADYLSFAGYEAGKNVLGNYNTALGAQALRGKNTTPFCTGTWNNAVGFWSLYSLSSGGYNTAIGGSAGFAITEGNNNTVIGYEAGQDITTGDGNVCIGYQAGEGQVTTGNNQLWLANTDTATPLVYGEFDNNFIKINNHIKMLERSSDPAEPAEGECVIWMSDGSGKGDDGDVLIASKAGGTTKIRSTDRAGTVQADSSLPVRPGKGHRQHHRQDIPMWAGSLGKPSYVFVCDRRLFKRKAANRRRSVG
jgi:hypothetical protein